MASSTWLIAAVMAALELGVDLRAIRTAGKPVILTVMTSLVVLRAPSVALIHVLGIR